MDELFTIHEIIEGECKGKFVIRNFMGGFINDGEGNITLCDTVEQAVGVMENTYRNLVELINDLS